MNEITVSTSTQQYSNRALLWGVTEEYNPDQNERLVKLVWRKTGTSRPSGMGGLPTIQRFAHWGLEITTAGSNSNDGYVWELRLDPAGRSRRGDLLASAGTIDRWRGSDVGRANSGVSTSMTDREIQTLAMAIAASMRRPMLRGSDAEELYGEYKNNCHRFARSLAMGLSQSRKKQRQLRAFFAQQPGLGSTHGDPVIGLSEEGWMNSSAY